ncbi:MAG: hypothetical protein GQ574_17780 [Crocinitomix sp.]|nr:hypothetical protein [Crocinitomix sp.]
MRSLDILKCLFYILVIIFSTVGFSQEPAYFKIGEKELSGVNIYNIFQDSLKDYWIATNNGLYKYNCFEFMQIPIEKAKSNSLFNFKQDQNKELYCHNLAGQLFKIENDSANLVYQVPDESMNKDMNYGFTKENRMAILGRTVFFPNDSNEVIVIHDNTEASDVWLFDFKEDLYFMTVHLDTMEIIRIRNDQTKLIDQIVCKPKVIPQTIQMGNGLVAIYHNVDGKLLGWFDGEKIYQGPVWEAEKLHKGLFFNVEEELFATKGTGGIYDSRKPNEVFFERQIISCFHEDSEGNKLAGTFGEGIIVMPNMDVKNLLINNDLSKVTKICQLNGMLYFGTNKGELFKVKANKPEKLSIEGQVQIEFLEAIESEGKLILNLPKKVLYDPEKNESVIMSIGSPKSVLEVFPQELLFATNDGVIWYDPQKKNHHNFSFTFLNDIAHINSFLERSYVASYDTINRVFYAGTVNGLKIGVPNNAAFFELNGDPIICHDIQFFEEKVYIATRNNGILIFKDGELIEQWNVASGFISNEVKQIKIQDRNLFGTTEKGFFQSDLSGKIQKTITRSDGLNSNNVTDFEVIDDVLWLVSDNRLQYMPLNSMQKGNYVPELNYLNAFSNEDAVVAGTEFDLTNNKFNFSFGCKSLRHKEDITYFYRLVGLEESWITVNYSGRNVEYKSLQSGNYTFEVFAEWEGEQGEKLSFPFTVLAPFWLRTWFLVLIAVSFILIILSIYFIQKRRYKRKAAVEQKLAKFQLATLKSQMNPHFLFNSLTSIQDLILQEKKEGAYKYISKFALLVRKILNQSDAEFIDMEEEVALLNVYLELEQLRFKKDFDYTIEYGDIEDIEIPPMLIQPIVENAIKHGLLHKKGQKNLRILFEQKQAIIICRVIDNGIGRKKALEIKERQMNQNRSFALNSIEKRMELLKEVYTEDLGVEYLDIEESGEAKGTEVIIKFPFRNKF